MKKTTTGLARMIATDLLESLEMQASRTKLAQHIDKTLERVTRLDIKHQEAIKLLILDLENSGEVLVTDEKRLEVLRAALNA